MGYLITGVKDVRQSKVGDTVTSEKKGAAEPLAGYREPRPMVYSGLYPVDGLHWRGRMVTVNRVTGEVRSRPRDREARGPAAARLEDDPRRLLRSARAVFEATAALFLARGRQRAVP